MFEILSGGKQHYFKIKKTRGEHSKLFYKFILEIILVKLIKI